MRSQIYMFIKYDLHSCSTLFISEPVFIWYCTSLSASVRTIFMHQKSQDLTRVLPFPHCNYFMVRCSTALLTSLVRRQPGHSAWMNTLFCAHVRCNIEKKCIILYIYTLIDKAVASRRVVTWYGIIIFFWFSQKWSVVYCIPMQWGYIV